MTEQHPLTDEVIDSNENWGCVCYEGIMYDHSDLRAAADWQLEQVKKWLKGNLGYSFYLEPVEDNDAKIDVDYVVYHLQEAMRPTTTQENN